MRPAAFSRVLALASRASVQRGMAGRAGDANRSLVAGARAELLRGRASAEAAEAATRRTSAHAAAAVQAAVLIGILCLTVDLYVHEDPDFIEFRVRRALRQSVGVAAEPAAAPTLPVPQSPPVLGFQPLMLLGPMGCGKSALLARVAREAASSRTPVALVRWRLSESAKREIAATTSMPAEDSLAIASDALFQQIDYPRRRAWLVAVLKSGVVVMGHRTQADLALPETRDRLQHALRTLFMAAADVQGERLAAGVSALDAAPVLLFDGLHDLVKDERLANAGGRAVFKTLALLMIGYCVDRHAVRAAVAGSSMELDAALRAAAPYHGRWRHYELSDPDESVVAAALRARGYSKEDAHALVAECGTRLRLLEGPLMHGAHAVPAADVLAATAAAGDEALRALFGGLSPADAWRLTRTLNAVAAADAAVSAGAAGAAARPLAADLPPAARAAGAACAGVIYQDRRGRAHFQARNVARAWERQAQQGGWGGWAHWWGWGSALGG